MTNLYKSSGFTLKDFELSKFKKGDLKFDFGTFFAGEENSFENIDGHVKFAFILNVLHVIGDQQVERVKSVNPQKAIEYRELLNEAVSPPHGPDLHAGDWELEAEEVRDLILEMAQLLFDAKNSGEQAG